MRKYFKPFSLLSLLAVAAVGLSGCSILLPILNGEMGESSSGGGSSGDGVTGTYTFDLTKYDPTWYQQDENGEAKIVDQATWSVTAGIDAYARSTLVLEGDGSYALTKEMGAGPIAEERWGKGPDDKNFLKYTYHGTYTEGRDGIVNLSECTSMDVETSVFQMSLEYNLGNFIIPLKTGVTDFEELAGTTGGQKVIDFLYGPYIVVSGRGNCTQSVQLGEYEWGTFTYVETPDEETPPEDVTPPAETFDGLIITGKANETIVLKLGLDGTYSFEWPAYKTTESGEYTWDRLTQTLTLTVEGAEPQVFTAADGKLAFNYKYTQEAALNQDYEITVDELETAVCNKIYSFIPTMNGDASLDLYADGTYTYKNGDVCDTDKYDWDGMANVLTLGDSITSAFENNILTVEYVSASDAESTETFIGSLKGMIDVMPEPLVPVYAFTPGANAGITFVLNDNGTYTFSFAQYGFEQIGTWTFENDTLTITKPDGSNVDVSVNADVVSFHYEGAPGLTQDYTGSLAVLRAIADDQRGAEEVFAFTPGANAGITFTLYEDGSYTFSFAQYNFAQNGTWKLEGDVLTITKPDGSDVPVTADGDTLSFHYEGAPGLTQDYTASLKELKEAVPTKIYSFANVEGGNPDVKLDLYSNGTFVFSYSLYGFTGSETGHYSWYDENNSIVLVYNNYTTFAPVEEEGALVLSYVSPMSAALNQKYTVNMDELKELLAEVKEVYAFTPGANAGITFVLKDNGTYTFSFAQYNFAQNGDWSFENGVLTITKPDGSSVPVTVNGDTISFHYEGAPGLTQDYTGSLAVLKAIADDLNDADAIYSFTPGKNAGITFTLYENGTYIFSFAQYNFAQNGTWKLEGDVLTIIKPDGTAVPVTADGDTLSFHYEGAPGLTQDYTGSLSALQKTTHQKAYSFTPGANPDVKLDLYTDGTFTFSYSLYGFTGEEHGYYSWYGETDTLVLVYGNYTTVVCAAEGDVLSFTYVSPASAALNQAYTGSVADLESALA